MSAKRPVTTSQRFEDICQKGFVGTKTIWWFLRFGLGNCENHLLVGAQWFLFWLELPRMFLSERDGKWATKNETALFSLFYRGSYGGLLESPHNWLVPHPLYTLNIKGPFLHCSSYTGASFLWWSQDFHTGSPCEWCGLGGIHDGSWMTLMTWELQGGKIR